MPGFQPRDARLAANQARACAWCVHELAAVVFTQHKPADRVLAAHFRAQHKYGSQDRRFISETFFSVFRWWGWLQQLPGLGGERLWTDPSSKMSEYVPWLRLLLTAHWLDSPAIHPAAAQWKAACGLTDYLPPAGDLPLPERAAAFAAAWNRPLPHWDQLVPAWTFAELPGGHNAALPLIETLQRRPPLWLRAQTSDLKELRRELEEAGLTPVPHPRVPTALALQPTRVNIYEVPAFREGRCEVQDLASQAIGLACTPTPGERWWDVCAGAGGKALQLATLMQGRGTVVATDLREWKLADLRRRARRTQLSNISPREWDGKSPPGRAGTFAGVLVDAPCSCSGVWRRNPDGRWNTSPERVAELAAIQQQILRVAVRGVAPGGVLVYATCSLCRAENEAVATAFLATHPEFASEAFAHPLTGVTCPGTFRIWPQEADSDAVFVARFRRQQ